MTSPTLKQIDKSPSACLSRYPVSEVHPVTDIKTQADNCSDCISHERCMVSRLVDAAQQSASRIVSRTHIAVSGEYLFREGDVMLVMGTSLTWSEAKARLLDLGWDLNEASETARLLEKVESFNYSGGTVDDVMRADLLDRTRQAVMRLTR